MGGEKVLNMEGESWRSSLGEDGGDVALHVSRVHAALWQIRHGRGLGGRDVMYLVAGGEEGGRGGGIGGVSGGDLPCGESRFAVHLLLDQCLLMPDCV